VISARERLVEGFPVTAGEIVWTRNGLGAAVTRYSGRGVYILVQLPQQLRSMSVRAYRKRRNGRREDAFRRRFSSRGVDRHRLADPEFRDAHVRGDVPSWTVIERELWAVVALDKPVTPPAIDSAVQRTLRVVRLLGLGPGAAAPTLAGSAVIPPRSIRAALPRSIQTPHLGRSRHRHLGRSGRP
jgi:hypothetical protein